MTDYLVKALAYDGFVRAFTVDATETVAEAQKRHDSWNTASAALGRTMVGAVLLGYNLKDSEKLTVEISGDGPGGKIVVDSNGKGEVRGYIRNPHISLPLNTQNKLDVRGVVGTNGTLTVRKDLGLKEPFSGQVPLVSGELGEDFTYYMALSEQTPSSIGLSVLVDTDDCIKTAGGFMVQVMPGATDDVIQKLEERIAQLPQISDLMDNGCTPEEMLEWLLGKDNYKILDKQPVRFYCDCSKEKFSKALITLGVAELEELRDAQETTEIVCHYCNNKYYFDENDFQHLINEIQDKTNANN